MTRKELLSELSRCVSAHGYPFKTGFAYRINSELTSPPEVWIEPPQLTAKTGRNEGVKEYAITMRIIDTPVTVEEKDNTVEKMESSLNGIITALNGHDEILKTFAVETAVEENTLTNKGDISLKSVFKIQTRF